jgi:transposase
VPGKYQKYSPEFREQAAKMVIDTSRSVAEVAREHGISETTLGNWVRDYRKKHADEEPPLELSEPARLAELERRNRELEMENAFLKKRQRTSPGSSGEREIRVHRRGVRRPECRRQQAGACSQHP